MRPTKCPRYSASQNASAGSGAARASGSGAPAAAGNRARRCRLRQQFPATVVLGSTYQISGQQFNGLSQAASFGDELETATNYPLVRITNNATHHVFYARTHGHSTMGVATGAEKVSTNFDVPAAAETGSSSLEVVANGIPSEPVTITVNTTTATPTGRCALPRCTRNWPARIRP